MQLPKLNPCLSLIARLLLNLKEFLDSKQVFLKLFAQNISQVAAPMLELASGKKSKDIQDLLHLLDPDEWSDADESEPTSGKNILYYPLKIYAIQK